MSDGLISSHKVAYLWIHFKPQCGLCVLLNVSSVINKPSSFFPMTGLLSVVRSGSVPNPLLVHLLVAFRWAQIAGLNDSHLALFQTTCCCCCFAHSTWEQSHLPTTNLATHTTSCSKPISMAWLCFKPQKSKTNNLSESLNLYSYNKKL